MFISVFNVLSLLCRYIVIGITRKVIHALLCTGAHKGATLMIPRIPFHPKDASLGFEFERRQFPVRVCFAMTKNKSQGMLLHLISLNLY